MDRIRISGKKVSWYAAAGMGKDAGINFRGSVTKTTAAKTGRKATLWRMAQTENNPLKEVGLDETRNL